MKTLSSRDKQGHMRKECAAAAPIRKTLGEKDCVACGKRTEHVATVYLGRQVANADGTSGIEWQPYTKALCPDCAAQQVDSRGFGVLVYVALQVCWVPLFTHGPSGLGLGGAVIAGWALVCLARAAIQSVWPRLHKDDGKPMPEWLRAESAEERDSRALRGEILRTNAPGTGLLVETLAEHRRHAG